MQDEDSSTGVNMVGGGGVKIEDKAFDALVRLADGDARVALNTLEQVERERVSFLFPFFSTTRTW